MRSDICTDSADHICDYFAKLVVSSPSSPLSNAVSDVSRIEVTSFLSYDNILDYEILVEEIEGALKTIKLGKSGGVDCLDPEHIYFGGDALKLWLKKIFNRIVSLEKVPDSLNERLIIPVQKGKYNTLFTVLYSPVIGWCMVTSILTTFRPSPSACGKVQPS